MLASFSHLEEKASATQNSCFWVWDDASAAIFYLYYENPALASAPCIFYLINEDALQLSSRHRLRFEWQKMVVGTMSLGRLLTSRVCAVNDALTPVRYIFLLITK